MKDKQLRIEFEGFSKYGSPLLRKIENIISCNECGQLIFKDESITKMFIETFTNVWGEISDHCTTKHFCKKCGAKYLKKKK